ncbi:MAG: cell wall hydrolase [Sphingobium sp.]
MQRTAKAWRRGTFWATLALLVLALPRFLTAAPLDRLDGPTNPHDPADDAGANFPGSAFFFAEGAFDPVPGALTVQSAHVMGLDAVQAAPATIFRGVTAVDSYRALHCLTSAIYYEAGNEPEDGQRAVAQVVLNRVRSPLWPDSVCGVIYQGSERTDFRCQFTFSCDGAMARLPSAAGWARARRVARDALSGRVYEPAGLATHYHTLAVRPAWAASLQPVGVIGAHIFYRNLGFNGTLASFRVAYGGRETQSGPAPRIWPAQPPVPTETYTPLYPPTPAPAGQAAAQPPSGWTPPPPPAAHDARDTLPQSTIRPEYRDTGRPLI